MRQAKRNTAGYIAITSAIILSILILAVAVSLGTGHILTRVNISDFDNKAASMSLARSCIDLALLKLAEDSNYAGNESFPIGEDTCSVVSVSVSGGNKIIRTQGKVNGATTNLQATVDATTLSTASLEELTNF